MAAIVSSSHSLPDRWLVVRFGHLGDAVLTTGALRFLAETKGWRFDVLTRPQWAEVFAGTPHVDKVVEFPEFSASELPGYFSRLAAGYAGWGLLDLHGTLRSRLLAGFWKGPVARYPKYSAARRLFLASGGRWGREALLRFNVPQRYVRAVLGDAEVPPAEELIPRIYLKERERDAARERLRRLFGAHVHPVALHPYATHALKTWPRDHWRELAELLEAAGQPWLVVGRGEELFHKHPRDFTNTTTLRESCAILEQCRVLISGDSGPMHLASAVDTPVLALYGPTTREWGFYPSGTRDVVLESSISCRPCSLHGKRSCSRGGCLSEIFPETVASLAVGLNFSGERR